MLTLLLKWTCRPYVGVQTLSVSVHVRCIYHVLGVLGLCPVPEALHIISWDLPIREVTAAVYFPYFTDEETEVQRSEKCF